MHARGASPAALTLIALAIAGCDAGATRRAAEPDDAALDAYCAVAERAELDAWVGDLATLCAAPAEDDELVACRAARTTASGAMIDLAIGAPRRALPASGGRLVLLLDDERLVLAASDGTIERELAAWASDPWVSVDGARVAWVGLPDGAEPVFELGAPTVIAAQDIDAPARTVLTDDALASTPRPIPGSDDVLYVSASTGLASFWIAGPGAAPRQLTNLDLTEVEPSFVPVADRQLTWSGSALFYAVPDDDVPEDRGASRIWRVDVTSGDAIEVGPGAWPRARPDGSVLALQGAGERCAAIYPTGGTP